MAIPSYERIMLPFLRFLGDTKEHSFSELIEYISQEFSLSDEEQKQLLPSGTARLIVNKVGWARTHLGKAGLVERTRRGFFKITKTGLSV